ncbi:MAG: hypothetical protein EPN73_20430 [Paraburkholderia sp.]|jgi:hypothetical protein|nr:MAG: hypothetical protein EPN73_20430 [Paraburkholderia sp.]
MPARGREVDVIDASVPLLSHDYTHLYLRDVMGRRGLIVIGVGKAGERGFQMLYRFSDICDRLEECGVNVIFVYQKESARHVLDATSLLGARYRQKPFLLLDDDGQFFVGPPHPRSLRAIYLDREMKRLDTTEIALGSERWDPLLRGFFAQVMAGSMH